MPPVRSFTGVLRLVWLVVKYTLAVVGGVAWIALWFQRGFWLGVAMTLIIVPAFWDEIARRHANGQW